MLQLAMTRQSIESNFSNFGCNLFFNFFTKQKNEPFLVDSATLLTYFMVKHFHSISSSTAAPLITFTCLNPCLWAHLSEEKKSKNLHSDKKFGTRLLIRIQEFLYIYGGRYQVKKIFLCNKIEDIPVSIDTHIIILLCIYFTIFPNRQSYNITIIGYIYIHIMLVKIDIKGNRHMVDFL